MKTPTDFLDLARSRQSDRGYESTPVPRETVERCLEAARVAPSACNSQPWFFVVVDDPETRRLLGPKLHDAVMNKFALSAPVVVAVVAERPNLTSNLGSVIKGKDFWMLDIGMAAENLCLAAASEGVGTCILGWFDEPGVRKVLGIPRNKRVPLVITLGYPSNKTTRQKSRKAIEKVRSYNRYDG